MLNNAVQRKNTNPMFIVLLLINNAVIKINFYKKKLPTRRVGSSPRPCIPASLHPCIPACFWQGSRSFGRDLVLWQESRSFAGISFFCRDLVLCRETFFVGKRSLSGNVLCSAKLISTPAFLF
jgi:hypothetical protein